jgi:hypothetical protein
MQSNCNGKSAKGWRYGLVAVCLVAAALPVLPLFIARPFYIDWINHVWEISYFEHELRFHLTFPTFLHGAQAAGNPSPTFYGYLFYPLLAVFSLAFGADGALRISCAVLIAGTTVAYYLYFKTFTRLRILALPLAVTATSSVYQLTNLYSRSAITEFFAHEMILFALPMMLLGLRGGRTSFACISLGSAMLCGAMGVHPITFYLTTMFVGPIIAVHVLTSVWHNRKLLVAILVNLLLSILVLAPWLTCVLNFQGGLAISHERHLSYFPATIDSWFSKIMPFSLDVRVLSDGIFLTSTPFLEAPLNLAAALLLVLVVARPAEGRRFSFGIASAFFVALMMLLLATSLPPPASVSSASSFPYVSNVDEGVSVIHDWLMPIQFPYRLSNTFHALAVAFLLVGLNWRAWPRHPMPETGLTIVRDGVLLVAFAVSFLGVSAKTVEVFGEFLIFPSTQAVALQRDDKVARSKLDLQKVPFFYSYAEFIGIVTDPHAYPEVFYGLGGFAMNGTYSVRGEVPSDRILLTATFGPDLGNRAEVAIRCPEKCVVQTNIEPNRLLVLIANGAAIPSQSIFEHDGRIYLLFDAGDYVVDITARYSLLYSFAFGRWLWLVWLAVSSAALAWMWLREKVRSHTPAHERWR